MIKIFKKIIQILRKHKIHKIVKYIIENKEAVDAYLDALLTKANNPVEDGEVKMTLDYVPSWLTDAKTLLEKVNRCVEQIEKQSGIYIHNITLDDSLFNHIYIYSKRAEKYTKETLSSDFTNKKIIKADIFGQTYKNSIGDIVGSCLLVTGATVVSNTLSFNFIGTYTSGIQAVNNTNVEISDDTVTPL